MKSKLIRTEYLAPKIVIVDGLPGCGKTMLSPILSSFNRTEVMSFSYELEFILTLQYLDKISSDAASTMIRMITDLKIYNLMMSRDTNFRPSDLSSVFKNQNYFRYIRRLFKKGDALVPARIKKNNPILLIATHQMTALSKPLFESLGNRIFFIEVVRHPLYMVKQNEENMINVTAQKRDFDLQIEYNNNQIPFYAYGYEEDFIKASPMEKALLFIERFTGHSNKLKLNIKKNYPKNFITVPFEDFVLNPNNYMDHIAAGIDSNITKSTVKEMKRQKVPRKKIADGISLKIYKRFGWEKSSKSSSERDELKARRDYVLSKKVDTTIMKRFDNLCNQYEKKYLTKINLD